MTPPTKPSCTPPKADLEKAIRAARSCLDYCKDELNDVKDHPVGFDHYLTFRDVEILVRHVEERQSPWRPIESAPRDGSRITLFSPIRVTKKGNAKTLRNPWITIGFWKEVKAEEKMNSHRFFLSHKHGGYWTSHFRGEQPMKGSPTHWMPLPEPPHA